MIATPSTIGRSASSRAKNSPEILPVIRELRFSAGELMRDVFPGELKRFAIPHLPASTISKARLAYFCGPFFRAGLCILALRIGGAPKETAQRLVDWLQEWVDRLWPDAEISDEELRQLSEKEQEVDGREDLHQVRFAHAVPGSGREWLRSLREQQALDRRIIFALASRESRESQLGRSR